MQASEPRPEDLAGESQQAHRDVIHGVMALEEVLSRPVEPSDPWLSALDECLEALRELLGAHFDDEREGKLYGDLPERFPHYAPRLERLAAEHDEILRRIRDLQSAIERVGDGAETYRLRELNALGQLLAAILRRHEAEENEIVMRAYWDEVGTGD